MTHIRINTGLIVLTSDVQNQWPGQWWRHRKGQNNIWGFYVYRMAAMPSDLHVDAGIYLASHETIKEFPRPTN